MCRLVIAESTSAIATQDWRVGDLAHECSGTIGILSATSRSRCETIFRCRKIRLTGYLGTDCLPDPMTTRSAAE
jgi:hypothetical protein